MVTQLSIPVRSDTSTIVRAEIAKNFHLWSHGCKLSDEKYIKSSRLDRDWRLRGVSIGIVAVSLSSAPSAVVAHDASQVHILCPAVVKDMHTHLCLPREAGILCDHKHFGPRMDTTSRGSAVLR